MKHKNYKSTKKHKDIFPREVKKINVSVILVALLSSVVAERMATVIFAGQRAKQNG